MILRALWRAVALALTVLLCFLRLGLARLRGPLTLEQRARWIHENCKLTMKAMGIRARIKGQPPTHGLLVANHLSYLDIVIFAAATPCFFVSKSEIRGWPVFGPMGNAGGTIFLNRSSRTSAMKVAVTIAERLHLPVPVLFFPEGTSSDGNSLLQFHNQFFEPAVQAEAPVTAASVRYVFDDGTEERELCWYGDAAFLPHLWKALGAAGFCAEVHFGKPQIYSSRKIASATTYAEIAEMRGERILQPQ